MVIVMMCVIGYVIAMAFIIIDMLVDEKQIKKLKKNKEKRKYELHV